ncbi:MFS general substrate transporter [Wilcoxina mikolae CBS 423.85]|nr:MFS general substrate transporter [Wilcoxina mikolae CBS 423.85]
MDEKPVGNESTAMTDTLSRLDPNVQTPSTPSPHNTGELQPRRTASFSDSVYQHSDDDGKDMENIPDNSIEIPISNDPIQPVLSRVISKVVTAKSSIVPRSKRRGLFSSLCIIPEIENPYEHTRMSKKLITLVIAVAGSSAPMASAMVFPALSQISRDLHATQTLTNLSVALYMFGMAVFPLWWSSFAERLGYRTIFLVSFVLYVVSNVCCAISVNIGMFITFRVCSGASAASAQTIGAGTLSSIWEVYERGKWMGIFYLGPLMGPLIAPIIGGALSGSSFGWRSIMWFLAVFGALIVVFIIFCLPETFRKPKDSRQIAVEKEEPDIDRTVTRASAVTKRKASRWIKTLKILLVDPLRSLIFIRFPPVLVTVYWASLAFSALYILNISLQRTFARPPYNFPTMTVGLMYIPNSLGYVVASVAGGKWNDVIMRNAAVKRKRKSQNTENTGPETPLEYRPEDRMGINAWVAGALFPLALLWYGWVVQYGVFWFAAMIPTFLFGIGSMLVFSMATTMLTEFVPGRSASVVAVNNFFRNMFSCVGGIVAEPIIEAIGNGWLFTIICAVGLLSCGSVFIMQKYGPIWRAKALNGEYKFMNT